jgi:hypothetical protein
MDIWIHSKMNFGNRLLLKRLIRSHLHHCRQFKITTIWSIYPISNHLVIMGPLTSILVNSVLSLCILFQGLKIYLVSKYTFAKNAHPKNENFFQYEIIQINTNNILHRIIKIRKFSYMFTVEEISQVCRGYILNYC